MGPYCMGMGSHLHQKPQFLKILNHCLSGFIPLHAVILAAWKVNGRIVIHDVDFWKAVSLSYLKVIGVVGWCDLYAAGSELFIHIGICNNRYFPVCKGKLQHLANQVLVPLIFRIDCHSSISKKSFRSGGGYLHKPPLFSGNGILDVPEETILVLMLHFCI